MIQLKRLSELSKQMTAILTPEVREHIENECARGLTAYLAVSGLKESPEPPRAAKLPKFYAEYVRCVLSVEDNRYIIVNFPYDKFESPAKLDEWVKLRIQSDLWVKIKQQQ